MLREISQWILQGISTVDSSGIPPTIFGTISRSFLRRFFLEIFSLRFSFRNLGIITGVPQRFPEQFLHKFLRNLILGILKDFFKDFFKWIPAEDSHDLTDNLWMNSQYLILLRNFSKEYFWEFFLFCRISLKSFYK